jgi:AAHS family 4-hydroxybenzoate transporter-like MFS transporter
MDSSSTIIETDALIKAREIGRPQIAVGVLGACALFVEGFDTSAIGYIQPQITREWSIPPDTVGTILSADLLGLLFGYIFLAPLSARFGHKRMVIACTTFFGLMTFLTITSTNVAMLLFFRFMTGVGVGGAMPSAVALTGEYIPERRRSTAVALIYIGFSIGQIGAGIVSQVLIDALTWRAVLAFGGVITLLFAALFVFVLPESIEYLVNRGNDRPRALKILRRMAPDASIPDSARLIAGVQGTRKVKIRQLLEDGRALGTAFVWIAMFMSLMIYFFMQKWLPSVLVQVGLSQQEAIFATTVGLAGGIVAAVIIGPLMDRFGPFIIVSGIFAASAIATLAMGLSLATPAVLLLTLMSLALGFCLSGGQKANNALSVYFYPTALRGPGLGFALGIGRIGGWLGPVVAGVLLSRGWSPSGLFYLAAGPMMIGAITIALMGQIYGNSIARSGLAQSPKV